MLDTNKWRSQVEVISPRLQEWKTKSEAVIVLEENGVLKARTATYSSKNNYEIELSNIVSILAVETYREGVKISQLYNRMISRGIKPSSLNSVVEAVHILGEKQ